jgi:nicotinate phosphoribosyltransferase
MDTATRTHGRDTLAQSALLTDLYQLSMVQAYHVHGMTEQASFELFFRQLPPGRSFLICAGLESVLSWVADMAFTTEELDWLAGCGRFRADFLEVLARLRFTGEISAIAEGTPVFANEPVLRITAPIMQAQLLESRLINLIHFQTLIASKAARCRIAAGDAGLVEFGLRRAHGAEAALLASRAAYLAGFEASSNALAGMRLGIPVTGTMAHSFVQAHVAEALAFEHFALANPDRLVLLIDTYDIAQGAHRAAAVAQQLAPRGIKLAGVRIDSGDLASESRRVRAILDAAGLGGTRILASGNLDEWRIASLRAVQAPIDTYCVGTALSTSTDQAALDCAYKLVEYGGRPTAKRSPGKASLAGRKQVWRQFQRSGEINSDRIALAQEPAVMRSRTRCEALLRPVMRDGIRLDLPEPLGLIRQRCLAGLESLPPRLRQLDGTESLRVSLSPALAPARGAGQHRPPPVPIGH